MGVVKGDGGDARLVLCGFGLFIGRDMVWR